MAFLNRDRLNWWGSQLVQICRDSLPLIFPFLLLNFLGHFATMASAVVGTSLFLAHVGAEQLPFVLLWSTLVSLVIAACLSFLIARFSVRTATVLFYLLVAVVAVILWFAHLFHQRGVAWAAFILGESAVPLQLALFWGLFAQYFTMLDVKRFTSILSVTAGIGGVVGSALAGLLALWLPTELGLLLAAAGAVAAALMLGYVGLLREPVQEAREIPLPEYRGIWGKLRAVGRLQRFYPIVTFVLVGAFLARSLDTIMKVEALDVIASMLGTSESTLTGFVGGVYAAANIGIFGCVAVARPVVRRLGVTRVNVIYPLVTFCALALLLLTDRSLIAAVLLALNYLALVPAFHRLIFNLNVIAVPARYTGQVRLLMLGVFGPLGLMAGAGGIIAVRWRLNPDEMLTWALVLAFVAVVVGYFTGRAYSRSLVSAMRRGALHLEPAEGEHTALPAAHLGEIEAMFDAESPAVQAAAVELAGRLADPSPCLHKVIEVAKGGEMQLQVAAMSYLRALPIALIRPLRGPPFVDAALAAGGERLELSDEAKGLLLAQPIGLPTHLAPLAGEAIASADPERRAGGIALAKELGLHSLVPQMGECLEDRSVLVRAAAARALPHFGEAGFSVATKRLASDRHEVLRDAIAAVGAFSGKRAERAIAQALKGAFEEVRALGRLPSLLRIGTGVWRFVSIPLQDYTHRVADLAAEALAALGNPEVIARIRETIIAGDHDQRAQALETFGNLRPRRFAQPLLTVLEKELTQSPRTEPASFRSNPEAVRKLQEGTEQLLHSSNRWLRAGAKVVRQRVWSLGEGVDELQAELEELLFLRGVSILQRLSLDELERLRDRLEVERLQAGEALALRERLYFIRSGSMEDGGHPLGSGDYFFFPSPMHALSDVELYSLDLAKSAKWAEENPTVLLQLCKDLSRKLFVRTQA